MPGALEHAVLTVDLVDETWIVAPPAVVAERFADPARWREWWPDLHLTVFQDRGDLGLRWNVTGALSGSAEVWLEAVGEGTLLHHYLRLEKAGTRGVRAVARERRRRAKAWKQVAFALKDELEAGLTAGPRSQEQPPNGRQQPA